MALTARTGRPSSSSARYSSARYNKRASPVGKRGPIPDRAEPSFARSNSVTRSRPSPIRPSPSHRTQRIRAREKQRERRLPLSLLCAASPLSLLCAAKLDRRRRATPRLLTTPTATGSTATGDATFPHHAGRRRTRLPWFLMEHDEREQVPPSFPIPSRSSLNFSSTHVMDQWMDGSMDVVM